MKNNLLLTIALLFFIGKINAQSNLFLDNSYTVEEMITDFFNDSSIVVSNITFTGLGASVAFFDGMNTNLGLDAGIAFSTGSIVEAVGPNDSPSTGISMGSGSDPDIIQITQTTSYDALSIEFDFMVMVSGDLDFNYVFGSEEYPEFVNSQFNDAFGFFISGPGFNGPFSNGAENISLIPFSNLPVTINNVNDQLNSDFYIDNMYGADLQFDGFTVPLPATFYAEAGETYHIKMVVSDVGDAVYDSAIFLSFNSLAQDSLLIPSSDFDFVQQADTYTVEFENKSKYAREWNWDFGNGQTSTERHPESVTYDSPATYAVTLETTNYCCKDTMSKKIEVEPFALTVNTVDLSAKGEFKIKTFPNPITNKLQIRWLATEGVETVQVFDIYGKSIPLIYEVLANGLNVRFEKKLNFGNYYVEVFLEDGRKAVARFMAK